MNKLMKALCYIIAKNLSGKRVDKNDKRYHN